MNLVAGADLRHYQSVFGRGTSDLNANPRTCRASACAFTKRLRTGLQVLPAPASRLWQSTGLVKVPAIPHAFDVSVCHHPHPFHCWPLVVSGIH